MKKKKQIKIDKFIEKVERLEITEEDAQKIKTRGEKRWDRWFNHQSKEQE